MLDDYYVRRLIVNKIIIMKLDDKFKVETVNGVIIVIIGKIEEKKKSYLTSDPSHDVNQQFTEIGRK